MDVDRYAAAYEAETRPGEDMYGIGTGHLRLPSGQQIAVWQGSDELASALVAAWWELWQKEFNAER